MRKYAAVGFLLISSYQVLCFLLLDTVITVFLGPEANDYAFLLMIAGLLISVLFMARSKRLVTVILIVPAMLFYIETSSILTTLEKFTGLYRLQTVTSSGQVITPMLVLCDPLLFVLLLILIHKTDSRIQNTILNAVEIIILTVFSAVGIYSAGVIDSLRDDNLYNFVVSALILFSFELLLLYAIYHRKRSGYYRMLSAEYRKQFDAEYRFFKDYKASQEDTIRFRHDWQNHMLLIRQMLANGDYSTAEAYFAGLSNNTPGGSSYIASGCELADMMITIKSELMENLDITFHFKGDLNELNRLEQADCCILLSNLLDNAIEANAKITKNRYITLLSHYTETLFYMEMKNPAAEELHFKADRLLSGKDSNRTYGIGLENIKAIVEKYNGDCNYFTEAGEYVFQMLIPLDNHSGV